MDATETTAVWQALTLASHSVANAISHEFKNQPTQEDLRKALQLADQARAGLIAILTKPTANNEF
ncbi:hypothetical protein JIN85_17020 [Luteolibacter pohnpeiensis]|uniref:Uncharacterized protein n=1 Tax=Luteolibacter pohnpeiensis TaxID=454153 RepID=A0A934S6S3_9BACT|nr:hypothetical protein [Luteolibacter pohnpeiensis]MBK1884125.1 hypothetical protein [Luteolibacter pohnpeiensis]